MTYLVAKWLHILSSTVLFGTGLGSAYYLLRASLTRNPVVVAAVVRHVVWADWAFTTTTIVVQPLTGLYLLHLLQLPLGTRWVAWSFALYFLAGACWLPVMWMQIRMRRMAEQAVRDGTALPPVYARYLRIWVLLGIPAFLALVVVFWLMVAKPT